MQEEMITKNDLSNLTRNENKSAEFSNPVAESKRKTGIPREIETKTDETKQSNMLENKCATINGSNFSNIQIDAILKSNALLSRAKSDEFELDENQTYDKIFHALLANINLVSINYKGTMQTKEKNLWQNAIDEELNSKDKNKA